MKNSGIVKCSMASAQIIGIFLIFLRSYVPIYQEQIFTLDEMSFP